MNEFNKLMSSIENNEIHPFYLLYGDEPFFTDKIELKIKARLIDESSKLFDYSLLYGKDLQENDLLQVIKRFPMVSAKHLVVIREAQSLRRFSDLTTTFLSNPQNKTVLVLCYKKKNIDKRSKLYKLADKIGVVFNSEPLYENKLEIWTRKMFYKFDLKIDQEALQLFIDSIGNNLQKIENEIGKIKIFLSEDKMITKDVIEKNIGVSKEFNNFELYRAIGKRDFYKSLKIIKYMSENPKSHPLIVTISGFYTFFRRLLIYKSLRDKSNASLKLGINKYFIKDFELASRYFSLKQVSKVIALILETDLKSKGVGVRHTRHHEILQDFLIKVFAI